MSFHQFLFPCCALRGVALPLSYSSGRLIGQKQETWRRLGIKVLVAPCSAIHHWVTKHWSGGTVEKPTHCLLMRGLTLVHFSPPSLNQSPPSLLLISSSAWRWLQEVEPRLMQTTPALDGSHLICSLLSTIDGWRRLTWWQLRLKVPLKWEVAKVHGYRWERKKMSFFE